MKHLTTRTFDGEAGCILSDCEHYRYRLWREWDASRPALGFIMLNPSTADNRVNDDHAVPEASAGGKVRAAGSGEPVPAAFD